MAIVYLATNRVNGKRYVGATSRRFARRRSEHEREAARGGTNCRKFHAAIRKYGPDAFDWLLLVECDGLQAALVEEFRLIAEIKPEYNLKAGGQGSATSRTMSPEARERWRAKMVGRSVSPETIALIVAKTTGQKRTAEQRERMGAARRGKPFSEEHKRNLSLAGTGKKQSPSIIEKRVAPRRGLALSPEHRGKISAALVGRPGPNLGKKLDPSVLQKVWETRRRNGTTGIGRALSAEHRAKVSTSITKVWEARRCAEVSP